MTPSPAATPPTPGTKAETLALLHAHHFPVPPLLFFTRARWTEEPEAVLAGIRERFPDTSLAVRSSACGEDSGMASLAGAFDSVLHVPSQDLAALRDAIGKVVSRYEHDADQVLVQPMIPHVALSGVVMTRTLDDGSPYYVINYDDVSGRTDTITSGSGVSKTVYVYRGARAEYFDSPRLRAVLELVRRLEDFFAGLPLDVEFVVDTRAVVHLLQARPIAAARHWRAQVAEAVSRHIRHVETYGYGLRPSYTVVVRVGLQTYMVGYDYNPNVGIWRTSDVEVPFSKAKKGYRKNGAQPLKGFELQEVLG